MKKEILPTFEQLVTEATMRIHFALLESGSKGFRQAISQSLSLALLWKENLDKEKKK